MSYVTFHRWARLSCGLLLLVAALTGQELVAQEDGAAAPPGEPTARVLGETLYEQDPDQLRSLVLGKVMKDYVQKKALEETEDEIFAALALLEHRMKMEMGSNFQTLAELPPNKVPDELQRRSSMAGFLVLQWKLNKSLFDEYGGRIAMQALGPLALDAQRDLLEERQEQGDLELLDETISKDFWAYFSDDSQHRFMSDEAARETFAAPPWDP